MNQEASSRCRFSEIPIFETNRSPQATIISPAIKKANALRTFDANGKLRNRSKLLVGRKRAYKMKKILNCCTLCY